MSNLSLFETWRDLSDDDLATELAREVGKRLVVHREQEIENGTTVWRLKDSGDMVAHDFLMEAFRALRPNDAVLSEEGADDRSRTRIDPPRARQ